MPVESDSRERPAPFEPPTQKAKMNEEHEMTKEEAIVALARLANATADAETLRALLLGCKALARDGIHRRRVHASQIRRRAEARKAADAAAKQEAAT